MYPQVRAYPAKKLLFTAKFAKKVKLQILHRLQLH